MAEKIEENGNKMVGKEDKSVKTKDQDQSSTSHHLTPFLSFFPLTPPTLSSVLVRFPPSCSSPLFFFAPLLPSWPSYYLSPSPAFAPHPISGLPLNESWWDNSSIDACVWEPRTETITVYPSSGIAWTLSFITAGPSLIKSLP